jgi:hypothetical protein
MAVTNKPLVCGPDAVTLSCITPLKGGLVTRIFRTANLSVDYDVLVLFSKTVTVKYFWCAFPPSNRPAQGQVRKTPEGSHSYPHRWIHARHDARIRRVWNKNKGRGRQVYCEAAFNRRGSHKTGHQGRKRRKSISAGVPRHPRLHQSAFVSDMRSSVVLTPHIFRVTKRVWVRARERSSFGRLGMILLS